MRDLVSFLFTTDAVVLFLLAGAVWIWLRPASRVARRTLLTVAVFYAVISTFGLSYAAGRLLVVGFHPFTSADRPPGRIAVVVLGSGSFTVRNWDAEAFSNVDYNAAARVLEARRVYRIAEPAWVVSSGGKVDPRDTDEATGVTMRDALVRLGVPEARVILEQRSRNTREEAEVVASMLAAGELAADAVVVVTSDTHMRRSIGAFRAAGIQAVPAIARLDLSDVSRWEWVLPSERGLWHASLVAHEVIGLAYYWVRGWYA